MFAKYMKRRDKLWFAWAIIISSLSGWLVSSWVASQLFDGDPQRIEPISFLFVTFSSMSWMLRGIAAAAREREEKALREQKARAEWRKRQKILKDFVFVTPPPSVRRKPRR